MKDSKTSKKPSVFQRLNHKAIKKTNQLKTDEPLIRMPENWLTMEDTKPERRG